MDERLHDTSWILQYISNATPAFCNLLSADDAAFARRADQLQAHLSGSKATYEDDDERAKTGVLRESSWSRCSTRGSETAAATSGIIISLVYDKTSYKFVLYGAAPSLSYSLLLCKASAPINKKVVSFLSETFHVSVSPLRLPSSLLQTTLQDYLTHISAAIGTGTEQNATRLHAVKSIIGKLKLTVSFAGSVAPHLKTLDLDVLPETTIKLLESLASFLDELARLVRDRTGLKLPIAVGVDSVPQADLQPEPQSKSDEEAVLRLSKITCAAFAISVDGRVKFASKAVDGAVEHEDVVRQADEDMLKALVHEAERRGKEG